MILFFYLPPQFNVLYAHTPLQAKRKSVRLAIRPLVTMNIIQRAIISSFKQLLYEEEDSERFSVRKALLPERLSRSGDPDQLRERAIIPVAQPIPIHVYPLLGQP